MNKKPTCSLAIILEQAEYLFRKHGYHATSNDDLAAYCKIGKSSLYHYIKSKIDMAKKVIEAHAEFFKNNFLSILEDDSKRYDDRLREFSDKLLEYYKTVKYGDVITNIGFGAGENYEIIRIGQQKFYDEFGKSLVKIFEKTGWERWQTENKAKIFLMALQGALIFSRIYHDDKYIHDLLSGPWWD